MDIKIKNVQYSTEEDGPIVIQFSDEEKKEICKNNIKKFTSWPKDFCNIEKSVYNTNFIFSISVEDTFKLDDSVSYEVKYKHIFNKIRSISKDPIVKEMFGDFIININAYVTANGIFEAGYYIMKNLFNIIDLSGAITQPVKG